jgi:hypothetical protein
MPPIAFTAVTTIKNAIPATRSAIRTVGLGIVTPQY